MQRNNINHAILFPITPETIDIPPAAASHFNPRQIEDLEKAIQGTILLMEQKQARLIETHQRRARLLPVSPPAYTIRRQIEELGERLELLLSEYQARNI